MKGYFEGEVISRREVKPGSLTHRLEIKIPNYYPMARAGQFTALKPARPDSVMSRPFTIAENPGGRFVLYVKEAGNNTREYCRLRKGDKIMLSRPRGKEVKITRKKFRLILIGGGIGIAALMPIAKKYAPKYEVTVLAGGKTNSEIFGEKYFRKLGCRFRSITEIGAKKTGLVTDLFHQLDARENDIVITCGPPAMMKRVAEKCRTREALCFAILETVMACNMGACKGCVVKRRDGKYNHLCTEGPMLPAEAVDWPALLKRHLPVLVNRYTGKIGTRVILRGKNKRKLILGSPILGASGCISCESLRNCGVQAKNYGALIAKGIKLEAWAGNKPPRTCETPSGMLNSIGLEGVGIEKFLKEEIPVWHKVELPLIANISEGTVEKNAELAGILDNAPVSAIELNISCPNTKVGGMLFGKDVRQTYDIVKRVRAATGKFLIVKFTPAVTDIVEIAAAAVAGGADALSLINTVPGMLIDTNTRRPKLGSVMGGLSGPAILPIGLGLVHQVYQANFGLPIIGGGGITDANAAAQYLMAGASAVFVGTGNFTDDRIADKILTGLGEIVCQNGFKSISQLTGSLMLD